MTLGDVLAAPGPVLALAPMQDVTDLAFWKLLSTHGGGADLYYTEYFRVTPGYRPIRTILRSITENPTGRPAIAQLIGNDPAAMARTARALERHPVAGVDLNLGCPAPVVFRKCAGGGLLRDPERVDELLGVLREAVAGPLTVKTRIGFSDPSEFDRLLDVFSRHKIDLLSVHGRTVAQKYAPGVHLDRIAEAVQRMECPVLANGDIWTPEDAVHVLERTGARGLMLGRGAVRNPWIFHHIRERLAGREVAPISGTERLGYVRDLYAATCSEEVPERCQVQKMKRYMNFIGVGIPGSDAFLHEIRRCSTRADFFAICRRHFCPDH